MSRATERQEVRRSEITGFESRRFSNGDLRPAESQVNYKYVQMDVGILTGGLSPNIHRSRAVASHGPIACFQPVFADSLINRFLSCDPKHYPTKAYALSKTLSAVCFYRTNVELRYAR